MRLRQKRVVRPSMDLGMHTQTGFGQVQRWLGFRTKKEVYLAALDLLAVCASRNVLVEGEGTVNVSRWVRGVNQVESKEATFAWTKRLNRPRWDDMDEREEMPLYLSGNIVMLTPHRAKAMRDLQWTLQQRTKTKVVDMALSWIQYCARAISRGRKLYLLHSAGNREEIKLGPER